MALRGEKQQQQKIHTVCVYVAQCGAVIYSLQQRCNEGQTQTEPVKPPLCVRARTLATQI